MMIWRNFLLHFRFAMELNEILESERKHLPKTDTRFRPDQRALEVRKNKLYNFFLWNWMNPKVSFKNISPPWENWNMIWFSWSIDLFSVENNISSPWDISWLKWKWNQSFIKQKIEMLYNHCQLLLQPKKSQGVSNSSPWLNIHSEC